MFDSSTCRHATEDCGQGLYNRNCTGCRRSQGHLLPDGRIVAWVGVLGDGQWKGQDDNGLSYLVG